MLKEPLAGEFDGRAHHGGEPRRAYLRAAGSLDLCADTGCIALLRDPSRLPRQDTICRGDPAFPALT